jgi:hypothetical protein
LEDALHCLAGDVARKRLDHHNVAHPLKFCGDARIDPFLEFSSVNVAITQHDGSDRCLSPSRVGRAEYGDLEHRRMLDDDLLDVAHKTVLNEAASPAKSLMTFLAAHIKYTLMPVGPVWQIGLVAILEKSMDGVHLS